MHIHIKSTKYGGGGAGFDGGDDFDHEDFNSFGGGGDFGHDDFGDIIGFSCGGGDHNNLIIVKMIIITITKTHQPLNEIVLIFTFHLPSTNISTIVCVCLSSEKLILITQMRHGRCEVLHL